MPFFFHVDKGEMEETNPINLANNENEENIHDVDIDVENEETFNIPAKGNEDAGNALNREMTAIAELLNEFDIRNENVLSDDVLSQEIFVSQIAQTANKIFQFKREEADWKNGGVRSKNFKSKVLDEVAKTNEYLCEIKKLFKQLGLIS